MKIEVQSEEETRLLAEKMAKVLPSGITIGLSGDLGAGKTTLTRYFCRAAKIAEPVSSPTFVLEHEYHSDNNLVIDHWDLYRLSERPGELFEPVQSNCIRIIEWIDKLPDLQNEADLLVRISFTESGEEGKRLIVIEGPLAKQLL